MLAIANEEDLLIVELTMLVKGLIEKSAEMEEVVFSLSNTVSKYKVTIIEQPQLPGESNINHNIDLYLSYKEIEGLSKVTVYNYRLDLRNFSSFVNKNIEDITSMDIRSYLSSLKDKIQLGTIHKKLDIINSFFKFLVEQELIRKSPSFSLRSSSAPKRISKALTIVELEQLRESCIDSRERAILEILYCTGCRVSEVFQMDRTKIDRNDMSYDVIGKGNKERRVYFSWRAIHHLDKYLSSRDDNNESMFVTERKPNYRLSARAMQSTIGSIRRRSPVTRIVTPHTLRHTFATLTLNNGADISVIQDLLGHSSPDTTLRYATVTESRKKEQHSKYLVL